MVQRPTLKYWLFRDSRWSTGWYCVLSLFGAWVPSPAGEVRFCKPCSAANICIFIVSLIYRLFDLKQNSQPP